ncbi:hypothetical protein JWS13_37910 [Rhodococcus pseudokoreensis]|uniref:Uncharacterized protein n=1 Tax=Rhodococcus pseudokoreensis TaxID=2811421 RepID=A0A974ZXR6_9NOCA|nr:hypothetical protein [Rhodococcus pseudokoreensis]QSE93971.1 hypothetical protein JWS13_37910 [Rhodococcus pseudokoreensis]
MSDGVDRRKDRWTTGLVVVSIMACGVIVAGLFDSGSGPATVEDAAAVPSYVTPTVEYPVDIPGCATVEPPSEREFFGVSIFGEQSYDNPRYPWFSALKASSMTAAVLDALPEDVEIPFVSPTESLLFEPIPVYDQPDVPDFEDDFGGVTSARGPLVRDAVPGSLWMSVSKADRPVPPCVAGELDRRTTLPDGTVLDADDTWTEYDGRRTLSRSVAGYFPDGTWIHANATDENFTEADPGGKYSGAVPLTLDDLTTIVLRPELRVSTPVPPGTPPPPTACGSGIGSEDEGSALTRDDLDRLNSVLDAAWRDRGIALSKPLGSLQLAEYSDNSVCESVDVTTAGSEGTLRISIEGGHSIPAEPDKYDPSYDPQAAKATRLPDGSVLERRDAYTTAASESGTPAVNEAGRYVTLTRPSGTQVSVSSTTVSPATPLPYELLESLATTPGLEL